MAQDLTVGLTIKLNQTNAKSRIAEIGKRLQDLEKDAKAPARELERLRGRLEKLRDGAKLKVARGLLDVKPFRDIQREIDKVEGAFRRLKASGTLTGRELAQAYIHSRNKIAELKEQTNGWSEALGRMRKELAGLAIVGLGGKKAVSEATAFEDALVDVRRAADLTQEEVAALGKEMMDLGERYGMAAAGVAALATEAGKTGIAKKDLLEFSRVAVVAAMNFDMLPEEAGSALSTLRTITKKNVSEMEAYVGAINLLGDSAAARERDIVATMLRGGADVMQLGASAEQAAALATALLNTGATAEQAGTALRTLAEQLSLALIKPQTESGKVLQALVGDVRAFSVRMRTDAAGAIKEVLTALSKLDAQARTSAANALFGSGLDTTNIKKLVGNMDEYNRLMGLATKSNEEYKKSLEETTRLKLDSPRTQIDAMKESWANLAIVVGNAFMPAVKRVASALTSLARTLRDASESAGPTLTRFAALAAILAPIGLKFRTLYSIVRLLLPPFLQVGGTAAKVGAGLKGAGAAAGIAGVAVRGFGVAVRFALGPLGLLAIALTAGTLLWENWGGAAGKAAREARAAADQMRQSIQAVNEMSVGQDKVEAAERAVEEARVDLLRQRAGKKIIEREMVAPGESIDVERVVVDQDAYFRAAQNFSAALSARSNARKELADKLKKEAAEDQQAALGTFQYQHRQLMGAVDAAKAMQHEIEDFYAQAAAAGVKKDDPRVVEGIAAIRKKYDEQKKTGASTRAAELKSIRASADAELSVIKDGLARQKQALEAALEDKLVSIRDYYSRKTSLEQQEIDAEIARTQALLAEQRRLAGSGDESQRTTALAEVGRLEAELIVLNNRRADAAVTNARKAAQAERELADTLAELKLKLAEKQGTATDQDRMDALLRQYRTQLAAFRAEGDQAGVDLINRLINVEAAEANLNALEAKWRAAMDRLRNAQELIQIRQNAGLLTETEARRQIVDLQRQSAAELRGMLPAMQDAAGAIGPEAVERMAAYRNEIEQMRLGMDELAPLWADLGQGFGDALNNMLTGATTWRDGLTGLFRQISNSFLQHLVIKPFQEWVAVQARMLAVKTGFAQQEEAMDMAISTKKVGQKMQEAGTVVSANAAEAGSGAANSVANIPYVGPILAVAAMATVFAAVMALMSKVKKFSTGGFVYGPGSSTSDSIPARLSAGEYVVRAEAVRRVGRNFLDNINGLKSGATWSGGALAFADGGMVPEIEVPAGQAKATTVNNAVNLHVYDDPQRIADAAFNTKQGQDNFFVMLSRDPARVRSVLGI